MKKTFGTLFVGLAVIAFGSIVFLTFRQFDPAVHLANPSLFVAAVIFQIVNVVAQFWVWRGLLRYQGVTSEGADLYRAYAFGSLGRYLPVGKLAQLGAILVTSAAKDRVNSFASFIELAVAGLLGGSLLTALVGFFVDPALASALLAFWGIAALAVFVPAWERRQLPAWTIGALKKLGKESLDPSDFSISRRRIFTAAILLFFFSWMTGSFAALSLFAATHGIPSGVEAARVVFFESIAYFGGLLAFFIPSGIGVRESIFYWVSQGKIGAFESGFIPIGLRASLFVAEILFLLPLLFVRSHAVSATDASAKGDIERLYRKWTAEDGYPRFEDEEYADILRHSTLLREPGKRVLDVGCGVGRVATHLKRLGHTVDGIDLVPDCVEVALREKRIDRGFVVDAKKTGLPSGSYDVVLCFGVLLHVFELREFFAEVNRLLKPGGEVLVFDHNTASPYAQLHFNRPDWVDRFLEGRSNAPRRALSEKLVRDSDSSGFAWRSADYLSVYTRHPNRVINAVHIVARFFFRVVRATTRAPWTGNMLAIVGKKGLNSNQTQETSTHVPRT